MIADIGTVDTANTLSIALFAHYKYPLPFELRVEGMYCVLLKFAMKDMQDIAHMMLRPCYTRAGKTVTGRMSSQRKSEVEVVELGNVCLQNPVLGLFFVTGLLLRLTETEVSDDWRRQCLMDTKHWSRTHKYHPE